jgi:hypothetical protein
MGISFKSSPIERDFSSTADHVEILFKTMLILQRLWEWTWTASDLKENASGMGFSSPRKCA